MAQLEGLLQKYSTEIDPTNEQLLDVLENIRAKYKMLCSLLGISFKTTESICF
jgi:hypothetical protein